MDIMLNILIYFSTQSTAKKFLAIKNIYYIYIYNRSELLGSMLYNVHNMMGALKHASAVYTDDECIKTRI